MAHLDRSTMDHLGSLLRAEYDPLVSGPSTFKQREMLFRYGLSEAALEAEWTCAALVESTGVAMRLVSRIELG